MKFGLIIYSETGNTLSVAQKLKQALQVAGNTVTLAKIEAERDPKTNAITFKSTPDVDGYDTVIFASPVQAFSLAKVMAQYLSQLSSLSGKKVACFVTQHLKKDWMGGNQAIKQITAGCKAKGADISSSGIVHWSSESRDAQIEDIVRKLSTI